MEIIASGEKPEPSRCGTFVTVILTFVLFVKTTLDYKTSLFFSLNPILTGGGAVEALSATFF